MATKNDQLTITEVMSFLIEGNVHQITLNYDTKVIIIVERYGARTEFEFPKEGTEK